MTAEHAEPPASFRFWLAIAISIVSAVAVMREFNDGIGYGNGPHCDSWYFFGIYDNYRALMAQSKAYQFYRYPALLPWVYIAPHISTIQFHELKFWTYVVAAAGLFSYASVNLLGRQVGAITAVLFSCSTLLLGAMSTDFVTGAGIVWECAIIAATIAAWRTKRLVIWGTAAGIFYACCIFTHLPTVMFIFPIPLLLLTGPSVSLRDFVRFQGMAVLGFLGATVLMGAYSVSIGNSFAFFWREAMAAAGAMDPNFYRQPLPTLAEWVPADSNLPVDVAAVGFSLVGIFVLVSRGLSAESFRQAIPMIVFLLVAGLCFAWELSGRTVLQVNVYAPWMYPTTFLALGTAVYVARPWRSQVLFGVGIACVLVVLTWAAGRHSMISHNWRFGIAAGATVALALSRWRLAGAGALIGVIAVVATTYPTSYGADPWLDVTNARGLYVQTRIGAEFVNRYRNARYPKFWMSMESVTPGPGLGTNLLTLVPMTVPRTFLYCGNFPASFPYLAHRVGTFDAYFRDLTAIVREHLLESGDRLFVIARNTDLAKQASEALASVGFKASLIDEQHIGGGVSIAAFDISAL